MNPTPNGAAGAPSRTAPPAQPPLLDAVRGVLRDLPGLIGDRVELLSLEAQRAGLALAKALALTVAAAILGVTAWLALWGLVVGLLVAAGWHWAAANGLAVLINLGAAAWAVLRVRHWLKQIALPATRRHLSLGNVMPRTAPPEHPQGRAAPPAGDKETWGGPAFP